MESYYQVTVKCGHVGRNFYVIKVLPVKADSARDAAVIARNCPRVKHHHSDAIRSVDQITKEEYLDLIAQNNNDPYFTCSSIQEQRRCCVLDIYDEDVEENRHNNEPQMKQRYHGKAKIRNPRKFVRMNTEECA